MSDGTTSATTSRQHASAGFTLLEMLIGLALVALVGALAMPLFRGPTSDKVFEVAVRSLIGDLRATRLEAIRTNAERTFIIDMQARSAQMEGSASRKVLPPNLTVNVTATAADVTTTSARLRFYPDGSASGGRIRLDAGTHTKTIVIDWLTGHVRATDHAQ